MKIAYIVPGFGDTFYCHNCNTSMDIVNALSAQGHGAELVPMYMPISVDTPAEENSPVFYGAVNIYLSEKFPAAGKIPAWFERLLDSRVLLKWISNRSAPTDPAGLEKMTVNIMEGGAVKYFAPLLKWLKDQVKPDAVHLSNALLIGVAVKIKEALGIPVFCNLDDENFWLDGMSASYSEKGWQLIRDGADRIDSYISASSYYAALVRAKTGIAGDRIRIVPRGIALERYRPGVPAADPQVIGFMSRMNMDLGLDILSDAFIMLKKDGGYSGLKLRVSGGYAPQDKKYVEGIEKKLKRAGVMDDVQVNPSLYRDDINAFFDGMTLMCVPARKVESFGSYMLESMASGVPVVQPAGGGYPELIRNTGGGITYSENTPSGLKKALSGLLDDHERILQLGRQGLESVKRDYTSERFIKDLIEIYKEANYGG